MIFAYLEQIEDTEVTDRQLRDAIIAAVRPLGYKLHATMDAGQVTKLIEGVKGILDSYSLGPNEHEELSRLIQPIAEPK